MNYPGKGPGTVACEALAYEVIFCDQGVDRQVPSNYCPNCGRIGFGQFYVQADPVDNPSHQARWQGIIHCRKRDLDKHPRCWQGLTPQTYLKYHMAMMYYCTRNKLLADQFRPGLSTSCWIPSPTEDDEGGTLGHEGVPRSRMHTAG
jgi:hypothetical protein